jgi:uncharacterized membrane protein YkoI
MRPVIIAFCATLSLLALAFEATPQQRRSDTLPVSRIIELVSARYAGKVIDADIKGSPKSKGDDDESGVSYEVRLLTAGGNILRIRLNAYTGAFLEVDGHGFIEALRP